MKTQALKTQTGFSSLERPRYSPGLLLEDEDLSAAVAYTRATTSLLIRSLFGCGVVCGLGVKAALECRGRKLKVTLEKGVALDGEGNVIHVQEATEVTHDFECNKLPPKIWVAVCWSQKPCRPRDVACAEDDDNRREATRWREGFELNLYSTFPGCSCSCSSAPTTDTQPPRGGCCQDPPAAAPSNNRAPAPSPAAASAAAKPKAVASAKAATAVKAAVADGPAPPAEPPPAEPPPSAPPPPAESENGWDKLVASADSTCPCYADHIRGVCGCDCSCSCVLLAEIVLDPKAALADSSGATIALEPDTRVRREVRPLLQGAARCLAEAMKCPPPPPPKVEQPPEEPTAPVIS